VQATVPRGMDGAETKNAQEEKLLVMPEGLARRFVLEERKAVDGRGSLKRGVCYVCHIRPHSLRPL